MKNQSSVVDFCDEPSGFHCTTE